MPVSVRSLPTSWNESADLCSSIPICAIFAPDWPAISRRICFERANYTGPVLLDQNSLVILLMREGFSASHTGV